MTLWAAVLVVLGRGLGDVVGGHEPPTAPPPVSGAAQFPDREARAFAVAFSRSYLTVGKPAVRDGARLSLFLASSLSDQAMPSVSPRGPGAAVAEAMVAREAPLGGSRALITVANFMRDGHTRYLTVPVARSEDGGLVVFDLPSFSAPPPVADDVQPPAVEPLSGPDGDAVADLSGRFLRAFLRGEGGADLGIFLSPGAHIAPMDAGLLVESVEEVCRLAGGSAHGMTVAVTVRVREHTSRAVFRLRYRVGVERRAGRWLVTGVAGEPSA